MMLTLLRRPPWPLPALFAWLLSWAVFMAVRNAGAAAAPAFATAAATGLVVACSATGLWRRALAAGGFPLSALALGVLPDVPAWVWLLALLPLLLAYPLRAWRDAPFFPTPGHALQGLDTVIELPGDGRGARVHDAGCGLGHGLQALHRLWPAARFDGVEWSRPLAWWAARRCRFATVRRGDMWAVPWRGIDVLYLFQRPESMARALAKAEAEMAPGCWLVSLEFDVPGRAPWARVGVDGGKPVWVYRIGNGHGNGSGSSIGAVGSISHAARR